ncbi:PRD domain-containing protein [Defluviitalea phaphyphila]|uniref:PRD domain-containing protein n=1 Tax=Defluviitalea phaphyphila TaxID=1473580 RepID=UPI000730C447|nr:PRD domain-containing protein [Defluviitalea phaphyphila]
MDSYIIKKVLNNNVVIANKKGEEYVLVGKAIGFNTNKGKTISENQIENIFIKQSKKNRDNFNKVLNKINNHIVGISEEIISLCEKELKVKLNESIHISLPDHINFAIIRTKEGIKIENPFYNEIQALYPLEFKLAKKALDMINTAFKINLPMDEAAFICMHIHAAVGDQNVGDTLAYTKKIGEVIEFLYNLLDVEIDKSSLTYIRTITHLNFMIDRVKNKKCIKNHLLDIIKKEYYNYYNIAIKVAIKIENLFSIKIPEDELGYITLHISRIKNYN